MRITRFLSATLAGVALLLVSVSAEAANPRIALVIGESAYPDAALPTAANDAGLVAQVLQAAGFDVVGARDLDQKSIRESLRDFLDKANAAGPDMQAFVYFSGRALQYAGENYLAPIDARIERDADVPIEALRLSDFTHALAAAPGLARVVVIDGARANPYAQQGQPLAGGLALVDPEPGSIIAFNAAPGSIGVEDAGDYGVYAKTLAGLMRQGGVDISQILDETRIQVNQQTQGAQIPWDAGKLSTPYFLFERAANAAPVRRPPPENRPLKQLSVQDAYAAVIARDRLSDYEEFLREHARSAEARRIEAIVAARREALFWRRALDQNSPRAYWTYLRRYPHGPHAYDASRRLEILRAQREPPPDFAVMEFDNLPPPPPREMAYADRPYYYFGGEDFGPPPPPPPRDYMVDEEDGDWRDLPPPPPPTMAGVLPTLAIAIPLMIAARAYHDRPRRDGLAPASAPPPQRRSFGPPPLPRGVEVKAAPTQAPARPPRAEKGPGQVKFAPPPTAAPGRPPVPATTPGGATPSPANGATPGGRPVNVRTPPPTPGAAPTPTQGAKPETGRTPLSTPGAAPTPTQGGKPETGKTPLPTPGAAPTPTQGGKPETGKLLPTPGAAPTPTQGGKAETGRTPLPTPGAAPTSTRGAKPETGKTPLPTPGAVPTPTQGGKAETGRTPLPTPGAAPTPTRGAKPETGKTPLPTPVATPVRGPKPAPAAPEPGGKPVLKTPEARPVAEPLKASPKPVAEPAKPKPIEAQPKAKPAEPIKTAPAPRAEAPKPAPAPHVAAPRPAPPPRAEAPRPAPAPHVEAPRPAPAPRVEPPKPAPAPAAKPAACGHPGQPHC